MKFSKQELELIDYIDQLIPESGELQYDFNDPKQYEFALMMTAKSASREDSPGLYHQLELQRASHLQAGPNAPPRASTTNGWVDMFQIPGLGLTPTSPAVASNGLGTVVGGYQNMNLMLIVQNNSSKQIVASGTGQDFNGELLTLGTEPSGSGSTDTNVTSFLHYSYSLPNSGPRQNEFADGINSGVVRRSANAGPVADPTITAPVRRSNTPYNPNALNIGLGRPWYDQGPTSQFDYSWDEPVQSHPIGKIPFVGSVTFSDAIQAPLNLGTTLVLQIYVANATWGGGTTLDAQDLQTVADSFAIDPNDSRTLTWSLQPGTGSSSQGNPITFGNVVWNSDMQSKFYCGMSVLLQDGSLAYASVQSEESTDDPLDGDLYIKPIEFVWHCLGEGTRIELEDGSHKPIEELVAGDRVRSNASQGVSEVHWTNKGAHPGSLLRLHFDRSDPIVTTDNHVFLSARGPLLATEIHCGDSLEGPNGNQNVVQIETVGHRGQMLYNLGLHPLNEPPDTEQGVAAFVANGVFAGDVNAQRDLRAQRRKDPDWMKAQLPGYLHKDLDSFLSRRLGLAGTGS